MIDLGRGAPVVLIPGIHGRWEPMRPAVEALAQRCRVITFSLCGDPGSGMALDRAKGFDNYVEQIDRALDRAGVERAAICGVSLGGLIALRYAVVRPARTAALILASTPGPAWKPDRLQAFCAAHGARVAPLFIGSTVVRLLPEIVRAHGGWMRGLRFALAYGWRACRAPASPRRMFERFALWLTRDASPEAARVRAPVLIVTGERDLDRVVPVDGTHEYVRSIPGARLVTLAATGHIGVITQPDRFAEVIARFVEDVAHTGSRGTARSAAG